MDLTTSLPKLKNGNSGQFFLIAGPCAIESEETARQIAEEVAAICDELTIPYIFKGSFRKANRSRLDSFTGIGDQQALEILGRVGSDFDLPVTTDIHESSEAALAAPFVDVLQIPAFLCRQTELLVAAAKTGKMVSIKKGQFMSPEAMQYSLQKVVDSGNEQVCLIDRGTSFGYQDLVVDYRSIPIMQEFGKPVIMDCTHSLQRPNQKRGITGGTPHLIETIARAAIAVGTDGLFIETHPDPASAKSDGANMLSLKDLKPLLQKLVQIRSAITSGPFVGG